MSELNISFLAGQISDLHDYLQKKARQQVNNALTIRNWLIGLYIIEYEQNGSDYAIYGLKVMKELSDRLKPIKGMSSTQLYLYKDFYKTYPDFFPTVSGLLQSSGYQFDEIFLTLSGKLEIKMPEQTESDLSFPPEVLLSRLSFSHFIELIKAETPLKRAFYEVQAIKNNWGVRELNRAIGTLLFERTGLSTNKETVIAKAKDKIPALPADVVKNPYFLEFLGLEEKAEYSENDLEGAIINHLQKFMIELGRGFCFEARQKRILIDDEYFWIDLVFYHRILKCHILVEIKTEEFTHENMGQLNVYLQYYKHEMMQETDNPPVGILLCTKSKRDMVKYATAANEQLFVSEYRLNLPTEKEIQAYIESKIT